MSEMQNQSNSNPTNPITSNSNPAQNENPKPTLTVPATPPQSQPTQTTNTTPKVAFHSSAVHRPTAQTKDYFAEQNQQAQAKKQVNSKKIKLSLIIICSILGVAVIGGIIWLLIVNLLPKQKTPTATPEEIQNTVTTTYDEAFDKAMDSVTDGNDTSTIGPTNETIDEATEIYNQAISNAGTDTALLNELRLSQMALYIMTGERYDEIIRIGSEINPNDLSLENRKKYYSYLAEAHWALGNHDETYRYYDIIFELPGGEPYGG